ncbi:MAG: DUF882 domain-containing protein [Rugosibacter sp.]|jgi:uncharacterized protein YcbK (DUF882 family)|nr:hypothetical protein [Rugosibacter sp.]
MTNHSTGKTACKTRRSWLKAGAALALTGFTGRSAWAAIDRKASARELSFYNQHTGESLKTSYWTDGEYVPEALADINHILRDHRTNDVLPMQLPLLDLLYTLHGVLAVPRPFQIISGYRSPKTNALLAANSGGVAKHSLHMQGMAVDIHVEGVPLDQLRRAAIGLQTGGVGYYPASGFVHVDIGRARHW